jgi:flagellar biosynthesis chaperone FliJ
VRAPTEVVRNLGSYFDQYMSMSHHIKIKCQAAYAQLHHIAKIRKYLDQASAETLIHGLVHSHLDYSNALLAGLPKNLLQKLQMVQNAAARVLCWISKYDHIQPTLKQLHWLPVTYRITFKLCVLTHKALHGTGPTYLRDMLHIRSSEYSLRSTDTLTLEVPKTRRRTLGDRAFLAVAPREWNSLPRDLRVINDLDMFKRRLKTHLFSIAYN